MKNIQDSIQDAAGGVPPRDGKTAIGGSLMLIEHEQFQSVMREGRKYNSNPTLSLGVADGGLWSEPQSGIRKPHSATRKAKARKATKAAAKSRRRNRQ